MTLSSGPGTNGWQVGDQIAVAAFSDASYNGFFTVASVTDTTHFTYNNLGANCASSCGSGAIVALGPQTNRRSAVLFNPNGGNSGLAYFENITSNGGGGPRHEWRGTRKRTGYRALGRGRKREQPANL